MKAETLDDLKEELAKARKDSDTIWETIKPLAAEMDAKKDELYAPWHAIRKRVDALETLVGKEPEPGEPKA